MLSLIVLNVNKILIYTFFFCSAPPRGISALLRPHFSAKKATFQFRDNGACCNTMLYIVSKRQC